MKSSKGRNEMKNLEGGLEATSLEKEEEGSNERDERKRKERKAKRRSPRVQSCRREARAKEV
jgi:hypothetical protein